MPKIILFIGLPGSGKPYLSKKICDIIIDDITCLSQLPEKFDGTLGICDVHFCNDEILSKAINILNDRYGHDIEIIYFENNVEKCIRNVKYRNDGRKVIGAIEMFSKIYSPPDSALNIWNGK